MDANPFHLMGVVGVSGVALLFTIHDATLENTLLEDGESTNTFHASKSYPFRPPVPPPSFMSKLLKTFIF